jgi:hypothetical protein
MNTQEMRRHLEQQRRRNRPEPTPWYVWGPIPERPALQPADVQTYAVSDVIAHYRKMPTVYANGVAAKVAAMAFHGVPITPQLLDYLETLAIRAIREGDELKALEDAKREAKPKERWVYFIQHDGRIKIGVSVDPCARAVSLSLRWTDILAVVKGGQKLEAALHKRFSAHRVGSTEWFTDCPEIRAYIEDYADKFSPQHPAYRKPEPPRQGVTKRAAVGRLARAISGDAT